MERAIGIGGVFFRARDPEKLANWYRDQLGIEIGPGFNGHAFEATGQTIWSIFPMNTDYFGPSLKGLMINYRVESRDKMLAQLRAAGAAVDDELQDGEYGKFGWATDPEGNRFEIWEPPPAPTA
ncbi:MAG TPA: VOC family protein [Myxococcales bacterium]|jgi:predicted enzyme related to lactoylglutathione lyase|nr:VOC family protein [Myxococcales bacterium]